MSRPRLPEKATRGAKPERVPGLCINAASLWEGFLAGFFRFYDRQKWQQLRPGSLLAHTVSGGVTVND